MEKIDKIVFGDNQFFGINHMSQEKAMQMSEKFYDLKNIIKVYEYAFEMGINSMMLNSNNRAPEITEYFRNNKLKYAHISWYPSLPDPHRYTNLIAEKGILPAINEIIFSGNTTSGLLSMVSKGSSALFGKDMIKVMQMLVDIEMKTFLGLDTKVIFLLNMFTDLLLGLDAKIFFIEYTEYIRKKYNTLPGFLTMNLPLLIGKFEEWGIEQVVICSAVNKIGYLMSPNIEAYNNIFKIYDKNKFQIMAMSVLASGAIKPEEAFKFVGEKKIESIVFGASSQNNIQNSVELIRKYS